ncbi:peptide synthetase [Calothrix parasitica NIES-267]|uniref:Peptide synthetase n=1 Tax=Calothrix parasitica NIES-267 TaxID=1973488 RepID=A0A1Z4LK88_9CYAN|nr:peptide synthetase [Calothrix parasitica NIES-267]
MSKKQIEDIYPLSPMQQGMLFHSLYAPDSGVYIIRVSFEVRGNLDIAAFEQAWQFAIDKHPVLRTAFVWEKVEKPLQVVGRKVKVPIILIDWLSLELSIQSQQLEELLQSQQKQGFNLSKAPLVRLILIRKQPQVYQFIWIYHHLLLDGWSVPFVLQDVLTSYSNISSELLNSDLNKSINKSINKSRPYKDYIAWLQQQNLSEAEQFWRKNLAGFVAPTAFRVDKKLEPAIKPNSNNQKQETQLSEEITSKLQTFAKNHQLTLNTLIQAAFSLMLSRYSGEKDIVFGVTSSGRPTSLANSESMVGLFINTLPLRVKVDGKQKLLPWLEQLQKQQIELQQYEYSPLLEIQRWSDIPRGLPLFESIIVFENYPVEKTVKSAIKDLNLQNINTTEQNNYPLGLYVVVDSKITLRMLYDGYRFDDATVTRILGNLQTVLEGMLIDSQQFLSELTLLTPKEQQQLLVEWNDTDCDYSNLCIHQLFEAQAERTPDKIAVIFESQKLTYKELNQKANKLARYLQLLGVTRETRVGICLERSETMLIGLLGILKAGGTYIPLDPAFPQERLTFMVEDSGVDFFVTDSKTSPLTPLLNKERGDKAQLYRGEVINVDTNWELIEKQYKENLPVQTNPENLAYIIYTSGSTGKPKGVQIMHKSLVNCLESMQKKPGITPDDTLLSVTTLSFDIAALELYLPLITGAGLVIVSREISADAIELTRSIEENQVTIMQATPATWRLLLVAGWKGNQQVKVLCGGEALDVNIAQELLKRSKEVWNLYGPTEATIWSSVAECRDALAKRARRTLYRVSIASVPIGKPINNTQFYVLNNDLKPVPIGVPGELYIGGAGLANGYLNKPELTAEKFIDNPLFHINANENTSPPSPRPIKERSVLQDDSKLYKTGDLVRYLPSGDLEYLGRIDYQVKLRGFRIELGEIEAVLMQHPDVKQAVVTLLKNQDDEKLIAYLISSSEVSQTDLREFMQDKLPGYMIPSNYMMLEEFPLTPNRKIDRKALPTPEINRPNLDNYVIPSSEIEREIAQIWQQVLQVDKIGIHDNFFDLGGHSLSMVKVHSQLREKFDSHIPLVEMFRHPTISALVGYFSNPDNDNVQKDNSRDEKVSAGKERLKQRLNRRKS